MVKMDERSIGIGRKIDFVILPCKVCQKDTYAIKYQEKDQLIPKFIICMRCLNDLP